jgi:AraC-like DNA-binding protein
VELLHQGKPIIDTAHELGYADQSHLTRSLKRLLGYTPRAIAASTFQGG